MTNTADSLHRTLTTRSLVMLTLAGLAPLGVVVGIMPLGLATAGSSLPLMYLVVGLVVGCFGVGFAAMTPHLPSIEGLWTVVRVGLGAATAGATAWLAMFGYTLVLVGAVGTTAYFFEQVISTGLGLGIGWWVYGLAVIVISGVLASRQVDVSARLVAVLVTLELVLIVVVDVLILVEHRASPFSWTAMTSFSGGPSGAGVGLMYAFLCFLAFEAATLYAGEARDPERSVSRATSISIAVIAVFFVVCSWLIVAAIGPDQVQQKATEQSGDLVFGLTRELGGALLGQTVAIVVLTSLFATTLGMTNLCTRYLFVLSNERLLPRWTGAVHPRHGAPSRAAYVQTLVVFLVVAVAAILGADPYLDLSGLFFGIGALAVMVALLITALAIVVFFHRRHDRNLWRHRLAPVIALLGLAAVVIVTTASFSALTGKSGAWAVLVLLLILVVAAGGALRGRATRRPVATVSEETP